MTSQGSAYQRFRRALLTQNMAIIDAAARELPQISLEDALRVLLVMADKRDPRFPRAAARLAARITTERGLDLAESRYVLALAETLPLQPEPIKLALDGYCRRE